MAPATVSAVSLDANQGLRECGDLYWLRLIGTQLDLVINRIPGLSHPLRQGRTARHDGNLCMQADKLQPLHL